MTTPFDGQVTCAVLDDYQAAALQYADWSKLHGRVQVDVFRDHLFDEDALVHRLRGYQVIVLMRERTSMPESLIARLPALRLLVTTGYRNGAVDVQACIDRGIVVCGTRTSEFAAAEFTWALMLAHLRHLPLEVDNFRKGAAWQASVGTEVFGRRLGVIGLGRLGSHVARIGLAFGMEVQAWSHNLDETRCQAVGVRFAASLEKLLATSDVVTVHLVLSDRTRGLIREPQLRSMRPDALLINTSRAAIVDEAALIHAVKEQWIGGAALDAYEREPLPQDHPYRTLARVTATPHLGYVSDRTYRIFYTDVVEDITAWLDGAPIRVIDTQHPGLPLSRR